MRDQEVLVVEDDVLLLRFQFWTFTVHDEPIAILVLVLDFDLKMIVLLLAVVHLEDAPTHKTGVEVHLPGALEELVVCVEDDVEVTRRGCMTLREIRTC